MQAGTTDQVGASVNLGKANIVYADNYGRTETATEGTYTITVIEGADLVTAANGKLTAKGAATGTAKVKISYNTPDGIAAAPYVFTVDVVASSDIKSYSISTIGSVFASKDDGAYTKNVSLVGKTANSVTVALKTKDADFVSSSDSTILAVTGNSKVTGQKAGKSTVTAYIGSTAVATQEVTVSEDAPIAKTATFGESDYP